MALKQDKITDWLRQNYGNISAYKKPMHTDQYLHYISHHQTSRTESFVSTLFNKVYSVISNEDNMTKKNTRIK